MLRVWEKQRSFSVGSASQRRRVAATPTPGPRARPWVRPLRRAAPQGPGAPSPSVPPSPRLRLHLLRPRSPRRSVSARRVHLCRPFRVLGDVFRLFYITSRKGARGGGGTTPPRPPPPASSRHFEAHPRPDRASAPPQPYVPAQRGPTQKFPLASFSPNPVSTVLSWRLFRFQT